jgi:hypothetical protein
MRKVTAHPVLNHIAADAKLRLQRVPVQSQNKSELALQYATQYKTRRR